MLLRVLVVIPLATAVVEEVIFRGASMVSSAAGSTAGPRPCAAHILFACGTCIPHGWTRVALVRTPASAVGSPWSGTFVATFAAGAAFTWLRERSGHLVAPVLFSTSSDSACLRRRLDRERVERPRTVADRCRRERRIASACGAQTPVRRAIAVGHALRFWHRPLRSQQRLGHVWAYSVCSPASAACASAASAA